MIEIIDIIRVVYVQINFSNELKFNSSIAVGNNMFVYTNIGNSYLNASSYIVTGACTVTISRCICLPPIYLAMFTRAHQIVYTCIYGIYVCVCVSAELNRYSN